jgi:hypothetical protein
VTAEIPNGTQGRTFNGNCSDNSTDGNAYQLRSRLVSRSLPETEIDKQGAKENNSVGNTYVD